MVYGVYDIIVRIETDTMQELENVASQKVKRLDKTRGTITIVVI